MYTVDVCTGLIFSNFFGLVTEGVILLGNDLTIPLEYGQMSQALSLALFGEFPSTVIKDPATQFNDVRRMMENLAGGVTNVFVCLAFLFNGS